MSASMAEVIAEVLTAHQKIRVFGWRCRCGVLLDGDPAVESLAAHQAEVLAANGYGKLEDATRLIRDLTDPDECWFDHHGGCQAHGYLSLQLGENCPQHDAKQWVCEHGRPE